MIRKLWYFVTVGLWPAYALARNGQGGPADGNGMMDGYASMNGSGYMMNSWGGHIVTWILLVLVIGALIYFFTKAFQTHSPNPPSNETPLDILKRRYAQGEITKAQFEEMKRDLGS